MKSTVLMLPAALALVAGCATPTARGPDGNPQLSRIESSELAKIPPARAPRLSADEIVRLSAEGRTPPEIILERYRESGSRLNLTAAQAADLRQRGVSAKLVDQIQQADLDAARSDAADARARQEAAGARYREPRYRYSQPYAPYAYPNGYGNGYYGGRPQGGVYLGW